MLQAVSGYCFTCIPVNLHGAKDFLLPCFSASLLAGDAKVVPKSAVVCPGIVLQLFHLNVRGSWCV